MSLKITIYTSAFCGSYIELLAELRLQAEVNYHTVSYDDAIRRGIKGTPSIWINGKDVFENGLAPGIM
jgi:hypothetical protein